MSLTSLVMALESYVNRRTRPPGAGRDAFLAQVEPEVWKDAKAGDGSGSSHPVTGHRQPPSTLLTFPMGWWG